VRKLAFAVILGRLVMAISEKTLLLLISIQSHMCIL
jgi:hypothetical protein